MKTVSSLCQAAKINSGRCDRSAFIVCDHEVKFGDKILPVYSPLTATITRYDLLPRFFCIDTTLLCEFESDKI